MFFLSVVLMAGAIAAVVFFGLNFGTDFKGGSLLEIEWANPLSAAALQGWFGQRKEWGQASISPGEGSSIIRLKTIDETSHIQLLEELQKSFGSLQEKKFSSISGVIGTELKQKSTTAIILALFLISIYIAFVFRKLSGTLSPWAMSGAALFALAHDLIIPIGVFAVLGRYAGVEITAIFVAAALTILGYSISDTVVVFDRVRENVLRFGGKESFAGLVQRSIRQTLTRSLNTTFTTLLSLFAIFFFGGESVKYFALALIVGIFAGAYSSIFVAAPLLVRWSRQRRS